MEEAYCSKVNQGDLHQHLQHRKPVDDHVLTSQNRILPSNPYMRFQLPAFNLN